MNRPEHPRGKNLASWCAAAALLLAQPGVFADKSPRIINGSNASTQTYPFMASLFVASAAGDGGSGCGASLIHPQWLLTAAHCFLNEASDAIDSASITRTSVTLNSDTIDGETTLVSANAIQRQVVRGIIHPQYDPGSTSNSNDYDIALLQLDSPVDSLAPISLLSSGSQVPAGRTTIIMGWGATRVVNDEATGDPQQLQQVQQQVVTNADCSAVYGTGQITDNMICAGGFNASDTRDSCKGDSGGPLVTAVGDGYVQVGLSSFGGTTTLCGDPAVPGVYTRVSRFSDFIRQYVADARFSGLDATTGGCANSLDAGLNVTIPCLLYNGQTLQTGLRFAPENNRLIWVWNNQLTASGCPVDESVCTTAEGDLHLTLPGILIDGVSYTAELIFLNDTAQSGQYRWLYQAHYPQ